MAGYASSPVPPDTTLLLTGATGLIGGELLPRLLADRPGSEIVCLVRAEDRADLERRRRALLEWGGIDGADADRIVAVAGDVCAPDLGLGDAREALTERVGEVFHAAASTRFDLTLPEARATNVAGTAHVGAFAREAARRGGLRRLHHVSTAYLGKVDESGKRVFRNPYEQTKWESEQELARLGDAIPITSYRPSMVVGDSRTGRTPHFRVLYEPMKWVVSGRATVIPCRPEMRVDIVPVDYVCDVITALARLDESAGRSYPVTAGEHATSVAEIIELSLAAGNAWMKKYGQPPIEPPQIISPAEIERATGAERERLEGLFKVVTQVLRAYVPYMLEEELFDDAETRAALGPAAPRFPRLSEYLATLVHYAGDHTFNDPELARLAAEAGLELE